MIANIGRRRRAKGEAIVDLEAAHIATHIANPKAGLITACTISQGVDHVVALINIEDQAKKEGQSEREMATTKNEAGMTQDQEKEIIKNGENN